MPSTTQNISAINLLTLLIAAIAALSGCATSAGQASTKGHLTQQATTSPPEKKGIPAPVMASPVLQAPKPAAKTETYSVSVRNIPAQELLFALSRDAKLNIDLHPGISGLVTLNAIDQTLQQILSRIAKQVEMRWEVDGPNLAIMPDKPYLRTYKVDFPNLSREVKSTVSTATQIGSAAGGGSATTLVNSETKNDLMTSLVSNVTEMLLEEDRIRYLAQVDTEANINALTEGTGKISAGSSDGTKTRYADGSKEVAGASANASGGGNQSINSREDAKKKVGAFELSKSVFANKETGVLIVRATSRQHEKVQQFIDQVTKSARKQVLIEATIVEVDLTDEYSQGINWSVLRKGATGFNITQSSPVVDGMLTLAYARPNAVVGSIAADIALLESFGKVKVLSSPKISVMNNQTATLRVANNVVYFFISANTVLDNGVANTTYTTTPNTVAEGFIMNVTPQISDSDEVTINLRPTITKIVDRVRDPNPELAKANPRVENYIPIVRTREMESILKVSSGQTAVMGGLMQDSANNTTESIPGLSETPFLGELFKYKNNKSTKSELVIFLRPTVIKDASLSGDFASFGSQIPDESFFEPSKASGSTEALRP